MRGYEQNPPLTYEGIDRAIAELLDVQPSGDFVAHVRARIEREPVRSPGWAWTRWIAGAAATASLILVAAVWWAHPVARLATPAVSEPTVAVATLPPAAPVVPSPPSTTPAVSRGSGMISGVASGVMASPNEAAGVRFFMSALRNGHLDATVLPADSGDAGEPMPIVIEPMDVEPLLSAGDLQIGELQ